MSYPTNTNQHLTIEDVDTIELAQKYGTPLYVYDVSHIRQTIRAFKQVFEQEKIPFVISYAGKAFATKAIYQVVAQEGIHADVVSGGELYTALAAGFPAAHLSFNGNNKSYDELTFAVKEGVGTIIVDNFLELKLLSEIAEKNGILLSFKHYLKIAFPLMIGSILISHVYVYLRYFCV